MELGNDPADDFFTFLFEDKLVIIPKGSHCPNSSYREKRIEMLFTEGFGEGGSIPAGIHSKS